jgi:hypothetical protein
MKLTRVLALTAAVLWSLVLIVGFAGIDGVRSQNVLGYPSQGQLRYYVYFPVGVLALVLGVWAASFRYRHLRLAAGPVAVGALVCLPCYLVYYTGGV